MRRLANVEAVDIDSERSVLSLLFSGTLLNPPAFVRRLANVEAVDIDSERSVLYSSIEISSFSDITCLI
jgi:hypothetical protein